ncbi:MAG: helix-turn-helix transcriptional regulator [Smithella sp.]
MENIVKHKIALMENVAIVEKAMRSKGWSKNQLAKESGVSSAVITRFFQDGMINSKNTFKILNALDLLKVSEETDNFPIYPASDCYTLYYKHLSIILSQGSAEQINMIENILKGEAQRAVEHNEIVELLRDIREEMGKKGKTPKLKKEVIGAIISGSEKTRHVK